jgi:hypothetical protein
MGAYVSYASSYETRYDILASSLYVATTYTVDRAYVSPVTLADGTTRKLLHEGTIMALNPANGKIVPNYTSYGFGAMGPLLQKADVNTADEVAAVVHRGDVVEDYCSDNGTYGTVLSATKTTLADRIFFVDPGKRL